MIYLAFDISTVSTGFAILNDGYLVDYGVIKMPKNKDHPERLAIFEKEISKIIDKYSPDSISIEEIWSGKNMKTYKILALYHGIAYKTIWQLTKKNFEIMMPSELRRRIEVFYDSPMTSKEKKNKELVFDFITQHFNLSDLSYKKDNDITDAMAVALATYIGPQESKKKSKKDKAIKNGRKKSI